VNRYPVRNRELLNFVAFAERKEWTEEGWSIRSSVEELLDEFRGWTPWVTRFMEQVPPEQLFKWGLFDREPLSQWSKGRVTLLGDAAHPVLPFLGHGAVLAIEDAVVLARAFVESDSIEEAYIRYESGRRERAAFVVQESRRAGKMSMRRIPTPIKSGPKARQLTRDWGSLLIIRSHNRYEHHP
jgi:salicylate hydroxylase